MPLSGHRMTWRGGWRRARGRRPSCQKQVTGIPASVSCIADGKHAVAVAANEQVLRGGDVSPFGFIGSITPLDHPLAARMKSLAVKAAAASGCVGSVGIDFVLGEDSWAIEVNPRFQATVDTVETSTDLNLFTLHMDACGGKLSPGVPDPARYAARQILFADRDMVVKEDLSRFAPRIADIPWPGTAFEDGQAVVSVLGTGGNRGEAIQELDNTLKKLKRYMG